MNCDTLDERKALLQSLGGLPETTVHNTEWLYMLKEDTRQSLAIEGYFASEEELEAVLRGQKSSAEITNYFRAAQTLYDQALQYYRDSTLSLTLPLIRHIHSELFRELDTRRGEFRKGGIQIHGARVQPPESPVDDYMRVLIMVAYDMLATEPILTALGHVHTLFESIHPFHDGNGRVGRILLNYLAISQGYPPIVVKGIQSDDRKRYYACLEMADVGFHRGFPDPTPDALRLRLTEGDVAPLAQLLCEGMLPRLDRLIALAAEQRASLVELKELAAQLGVREDALRQRIHRGRLIAIKRGKKLYSAPLLMLPAPPPDA